MENVKNGGAGSGDFNHAGNPPHVGGSEPIESRHARGFKSKSEKKETKDITKEEHKQIKEKVSKMSDEELIKTHFDAMKGFESEKAKAGDLSKNEVTYGIVAQELKKRTGRGFSMASSKEEIERALKEKSEDKKVYKNRHAEILYKDLPDLREKLHKAKYERAKLKEKKVNVLFYDKKIKELEKKEQELKEEMAEIREKRANNSLYKHEFIEY